MVNCLSWELHQVCLTEQEARLMAKLFETQNYCYKARAAKPIKKNYWRVEIRKVKFE